MDSVKFQEFVRAQDACYANVTCELSSGRKLTHWMWFIFPQIAGLGTSAMATKFALSSLDEAKRYLNHPVLGARLRECTTLLLAVRNQSIDSILGSPDNAKFRSCITLFAQAAPDETLFRHALDQYFEGSRDPNTVALLESQQ